MKQIMVNLRSGEVLVEDVPAPVMKGEGVIVHNHFSVISGGTEGSLLDLASSSYLSKIKKRPELFKKVLDMAKKQGPITAYQAVSGRLDKLEPMGYSCTGVVKEVSANSPLRIGDRVACGGVGYASHADVVFVPNNLCVKVPENVNLREAAFTTLGAVAMQGVRNSKTNLGERVAVIGLGLLGQLTVQILKSSGIRVFGIEIDQKKIDLAKELGLDDGCTSTTLNLEERVEAFTEGIGCDAVIITASTSSNDPLVTAGRIARQKGRVVLVGVVGMEIPRETFYAKELEFVISSSYGPGRYDPEYEELGHDYPIGYVRWTERRNMSSFLDLISQKKITLDKLITHEFHINHAVKAYDIISGKNKTPYIGMLIKYNKNIKNLDKVTFKDGVKIKKHGKIGIGWIGAGSFATTTLLPSLKRSKEIELIGISSGSGSSSISAAKHYGFEYAASSKKTIFNDPRVDAVVITTRNSSHARLTIEALDHGKHVLVEKPIAINKEELSEITKAHERCSNQIIQVGYNRRCAPMTDRVLSFFKERRGPMIVNYRINAGKLPKNSWIYEDREGGSRYISELCHFIDYCQYIVGSRIISHSEFKLRGGSLNKKEEEENVVMSLKFKDGSVADIVYNTIGDPSYAKELIEIHADGSTAVVKDFRFLELTCRGKRKRFKDYIKTDKGHMASFDHFLKNIREGKDEFEDYIPTMEILFGMR